LRTFATATGANSTANGTNATATGQRSIANGGLATATGQGSIANGIQATVSAPDLSNLSNLLDWRRRSFHAKRGVGVNATRFCR
jgi:hypothetical protein